MCVGRCSRRSSVHTVVVYREAPSFSFPPSNQPPPRVSQQDVPATHWRRAAAISNDGPITGPQGWSKKPAPRRQEELLGLSGICFMRSDSTSCSSLAWICILDLVRNQLEHTIDLPLLCRRPYGGWTCRGWCVSGATKGVRHRHLATRRAWAVPTKRRPSPPSCHAACSSWALESVDIGFSRAAFVSSTLFLSSMRHHQVLRVLSACSQA